MDVYTVSFKYVVRGYVEILASSSDEADSIVLSTLQSEGVDGLEDWESTHIEFSTIGDTTVVESEG